MDYTRIPRELIYRDRRNLDEFFEANELNAALIKNMKDIDVLITGDFENHALMCMNAAYYICTFFILEKHPEWKLSKMASYIDTLNLHPVKAYETIVFSLAYILLKHYNNKGWQENKDELLKQIYFLIYPNDRHKEMRVHVYLVGGKKDILQTLETNLPQGFVLPEDEFAPRVIDCETASDVMDKPFRWDVLTDNYKEDKIREIINALGRNPEEERWIEKIINEAHTNSPITETAQLKKQSSVDDNSKDLQAELAASSDRIKELEEELRELREYKKENEEMESLTPEKALGIDELAIFFSFAVGLDFDPTRTNQTQLSAMISKLCGNTLESIRARISRMNQMEKNNNLSDEVMQAARNVKGMLEKISHGNLTEKMKDIIKNIDLVFLNSK